jgi:hypothetical protein
MSLEEPGTPCAVFRLCNDHHRNRAGRVSCPGNQGFLHRVDEAHARRRCALSRRWCVCVRAVHVFLLRSDFPKAKRVFEAAGYESELNFPHWLGKAIKGDDFVDLIFSAGNGVAVVDDLWFDFAVDDEVFGVDVKLIPAEEMIWSKGLIMERERFDGADVAHVLLATGDRLDWRRLIDRYGKHWRALYAHLVLFGFSYPSERSRIPAWVMTELTARIANETNGPDAAEKICFGTILSRQQYLTDIKEWGYKDGRLRPIGNMSAEEIAQWTAGIEVDGSK